MYATHGKNFLLEAKQNPNILIDIRPQPRDNSSSLTRGCQMSNRFDPQHNEERAPAPHNGHAHPPAARAPPPPPTAVTMAPPTPATATPRSTRSPQMSHNVPP